MRDMMRSDWKQIREKDFTIKDAKFRGTHCKIGLLNMRRVEPAVSVGRGDDRVVIADRGYAWLQAAEENGRIWMTAMYDADGRFVQIYFDVTRGNSFADHGNPAFEDLYLDLVVKTDGRIVELDRDELDAALERGEIAPEEHAAAAGAMERLKRYLAGNLPELLEFCAAQYREMRKK